MVFSSTVFLFIFLPVTLLVYYLMKEQYRNYWLLLVSLVFFGWSQPGYLWIILLSILINYSCAALIGRAEPYRKAILVLAVTANLLILFYFKYFDFAIDTVNKLTGSDFALKNIVLPIGISFFTFQGMSYVMDVYKGDVPAENNIFNVGLYIVLFPQLIAGPIVRYKDIAREVKVRRSTLDDFSSGIERFIIGLAKKAVIANTMASAADAIWNNGAANNTWLVAWGGSIAYTLQIYYDFSGYSDMAIGLGRMFGFHFNENFDLPYISGSISEFWRRWHISLSSWFRDYVYIPLGGNRKNVYRNLSIVFLLTGLWHGASWHFVAWGLWNLLFILIERVCKTKRRGGKRQDPGMARTFLSKLYTLLAVNFGWVLFRAPNTRTALTYAAAMLGRIAPERPGFTFWWYFDRWTVTVLIAGVFFASSVPGRIGAAFAEKCPPAALSAVKYIILLLLFYLSMIRVVAGTYNPFIYFQF